MGVFFSSAKIINTRRLCRCQLTNARKFSQLLRRSILPLVRRRVAVRLLIAEGSAGNTGRALRFQLQITIGNKKSQAVGLLDHT